MSHTIICPKGRTRQVQQPLKWLARKIEATKVANVTIIGNQDCHYTIVFVDGTTYNGVFCFRDMLLSWLNRKGVTVTQVKEA
jgi:hypothetical protein